MISGVCECGHTSTAIHNCSDVVALASGHGHYPREVKLTCSCGDSFEMGPTKLNRELLEKLNTEEYLNFLMADAALSFRTLRCWLRKHENHKSWVM